MGNRRTKRLGISSLLIISLSLLGYNALQTGRVDVPRTTAPVGTYEVTTVSDGDTFDVRIAGQEERVRMIGVDTPETKDPRRPVQCFGKAASDYTKAQLLGKRVRLEAEPSDSDRDKYRRLLRYVYLEDGTLFNAELIRQGYAFAYTVYPYQKLEEFRVLEREARAASRGLWAGCSIDEQNPNRKQTESHE